MSYKLYQLSGGNRSLFKNDRQEKLSKFSIFSQKYRKKLFYFREKQEIQFASLEVESGGFGGGLPYKRDGDIYHFALRSVNWRLTLGRIAQS